jgi:hypothetical protein
MKQGRDQQPRDDRAQSPGAAPDNQGEGNREADRNYREATRDFVESGKVDDAARKANPQSAEEADEMRRAEREGRSHAKEEDPALKRGAKP